MEKQKLPNQQAVMILGILSYIGCCCSNGIIGVLLSGIGIYLANKDEKLLAENPENYLPGSLKTWKTINIVNLVVSSLFVLILIYLVATGKYDEMQEQYIRMLEEMQKGQ